MDLVLPGRRERGVLAADEFEIADALEFLIIIDAGRAIAEAELAAGGRAIIARPIVPTPASASTPRVTIRDLLMVVRSFRPIVAAPG